ncbi:MAG TPA: cell division protein ZapB [Desulfobacterales bacterium]|nr:cell division protein ZapB [Desulfobacterales bacterium]
MDNYSRKGLLVLDIDALFSQFAEIETKVEKLIEICRSQQTANLELHHKIKQLEEELHVKNEAVKRQMEEKALIRSRIDKLLARLEETNPS